MNTILMNNSIMEYKINPTFGVLRDAPKISKKEYNEDMLNIFVNDVYQRILAQLGEIVLGEEKMSLVQANELRKAVEILINARGIK